MLAETVRPHYDRFLDHVARTTEYRLSQADMKFTDMQKLGEEFIEAQSDLSSDQKNRLCQEINEWGPLTSILKDETVTEIMINSYDSIWLEENGKLQRYSDQFCSERSYHRFIQKLCYVANIKYDLDRPFCNGNWESFRLHIVAPPLTESGPVVTLRRHPKNPWTLRTLAENQWSDEAGVKTIIDLLDRRTNIIVVGGTGCGKTSVLNACLHEVVEKNPQERFVVIEDTSEVQMPAANGVKLLTRVAGSEVLKDYHQDALIKEALRMRPDRLVVGEVRGAEAKDLLMALATGHSGSMGTLHADDARQALIRLEMLIQLGAPQWSLHAIRHLIRLSLEAIIVVRRAGHRRVLHEICRISSLEDSGFCLDRLYPSSSLFQN